MKAHAARYWRYGLVGVVAGLTSGLFGVGGGIVIVPLLVGLVGFGQRLAHGTSLTAILPISTASALGYATQGEVEWVIATLVSLGAMAGAIVGSHLLQRLPVRALRLGFAFILIVTAVRMVTSSGDGSGIGDLGLVGALGYLILGLASGVLAGTLGVGGGAVLVPALTFFAGFPLLAAKGTSLLVIIPTSLIGTWRNVAAKNTDVMAGLVVGVTGIVFGLIGVRISLELSAKWGSVLFAVLLVVAAVKLVFQAEEDEPTVTVIPDPSAETA